MKKITIGIPIIGYIIMMSFIVACSSKKKEVVKEEDDFLKIPTYETPAYTLASTYTPIYNTKSSSMTPTYWFVQFYEEKKEGDDWTSQDWRWAVKINTPYFDFIEARKDLPSEVTGKVFFNNIVQLNKESYDSFFKYRELYIDNK